MSMNEGHDEGAVELTQAKKECCGHTHSCCGGKGCDPLAIVMAVAMSAVLGFAIFAKFYAPNPKQVALEYGIGAAEIAVVLGLVMFHRKWWAWSGMTVMWAGLAGYSFFKSWHGEACGCFSTLWEPPAYFTGALDSAFAMIALGLSARRGAPGVALAGAFVLAMAAGLAGWQVGDQTTPPRRAEVAQVHEGKDAKQRLLESEVMADVLAQEPGAGPAWLVFCFDPTCHICEAVKPFMEFKQAEYRDTGDPVMQIRMFSVPDLEKQVKIEVYAWETPTLFVVKDGKITKSWVGKAIEGWTDANINEIWEKLADGEYAEEEVAAASPPADAKK